MDNNNNPEIRIVQLSGTPEEVAEQVQGLLKDKLGKASDCKCGELNNKHEFKCGVAASCVPSIISTYGKPSSDLTPADRARIMDIAWEMADAACTKWEAAHEAHVAEKDRTCPSRATAKLLDGFEPSQPRDHH